MTLLFQKIQWHASIYSYILGSSFTNLQLHDPVTWLSSPSNEPLPKIIVLEVVLIQPSLQQNSDADEPNTTAITEWGSPMECHENQKKNAVAEDHNGTKAYSKMVDSDEETSWSSSEVEPCISGYEKHFMPTAADIVEDFWFPQGNSWTVSSMNLTHWTMFCISFVLQTGQLNYMSNIQVRFSLWSSVYLRYTSHKCSDTTSLPHSGETTI